MSRSGENDAVNTGMAYWGFRILLPVAIGLGVAVWLFHREFSPQVWSSFRFTPHAILAITLAWMAVLGREFGLGWRFRALTDRELRWSQALRVTFLCEFTSCVTPSSAGGSALSMFFLKSEGINLGRATTLMLTTLFLDELFFCVALPVVVMLIPYREIFGFTPESQSFTVGLRAVFWIVYIAIVLWTALLYIGLIVRPEAVKRFLVRLFRLRLLRRWLPQVEELTENMVATSRELRRRPRGWWCEAFLATAVSWTSRFLVVNALFWGFAPLADQGVVFGRQFVIWVVLTVSPTPGGSGLSEWLFTEYYGDMIAPGVALVLAMFWRIISYYVYLIIGACLLPGFLKRIVGPKKSEI